MTRQEAGREAQKRWGKSGYIRAHEAISSPERRESANVAFQQAKAELEALDLEMEEKLAACEWYQDIQRRRTDARKRKEATARVRSYRKFAVGTLNGIGFWVEGQGDTWEEAFAAATRNTDKVAS